MYPLEMPALCPAAEYLDGLQAASQAPPHTQTTAPSPAVGDRPRRRRGCQVTRVAERGQRALPISPAVVVVDLADDGVIGVADDQGASRPRLLVADGALVVSVMGCSAVACLPDSGQRT